MCGIAGILKINGSTIPEDVSTVRRMMDAQIHRGRMGRGCIDLRETGEIE
jgi:asparagine synthetase B (glutamine-hydrolysing)